MITSFFLEESPRQVEQENHWFLSTNLAVVILSELNLESGQIELRICLQHIQCIMKFAFRAPYLCDRFLNSSSISA